MSSIDQPAYNFEYSSEWHENAIVLHVNGTAAQAFGLEEKVTNQHFSTMIETGSPIKFFTSEDLRRNRKTDSMLPRPLPKEKEYLLGFTTVVKVGKRNIKAGEFYQQAKEKTRSLEYTNIVKQCRKIPRIN